MYAVQLYFLCIVDNPFIFVDADYPGMNEVTLLTAVTVFVLFGAQLINKSQPIFSSCMRIYLDCWQSSDTEVGTSISFILQNSKMYM